MSKVRSRNLSNLKSQLGSRVASERKNALKKAIAGVDSGKSAQKLFPEVLGCMHAGSLELKKLAQLYLLRYAPEFPNVAIMATNTLVMDCQSNEPLVRARALRTMGYMRLEVMPDHLGEPLYKALHDQDDYVRKTAAICVAKLHAMSPEAVSQFGLFDVLRRLLDDPNPMVVSNTVAALSELSPLAELLPRIQQKLLASLDKCTEWGRVYILDTLRNYAPVEEVEVKTIFQIISPHLAHKNSAVVVSVARILMKLMPVFEDCDFVSSLEEKLPGAMVAFLSSEPEIQFVVLQEIQNIVRQRPNIFQGELRSFFVKYNDPIYVKLGKLDVISHLIRADNVSLVLSELKGYVFEMDEEFARASIRAIGNCAAVVESYSLSCLWVLQDLARMGICYISQTAIVAIQDILRAYPVRHERMVAIFCDNLPPLIYPEAKASVIWMIGEYAEVVDDAAEILDDFLEGFLVESPLVQLQLLTSVIKVFLKKPDTYQNLATQTLNMCTTEVENPDLRDRGFFYKRLLSVGSEIAKQVVLHKELRVHEENKDTLLDFGYTRLS